MTAFYSWRLILMTFHGKPRADEKVMAHIHESPSVMISPLVVLATGAIMAGSLFYGGFVGSHEKPEGAHGNGHGEAKQEKVVYVGEFSSVWEKDRFWGESLFVLPENDTVKAAHHVPVWVKKLPILMGALGIFLAYVFYLWREGMAGKIARRFGPFYRLFYNKWYFDELYEKTFVRRALRLGKLFSVKGDKQIIDGLGPDGVSALSKRFAGYVASYQTGYVYHYAFTMMLGVIAIVSWVMYRIYTG